MSVTRIPCSRIPGRQSHRFATRLSRARRCCAVAALLVGALCSSARAQWTVVRLHPAGAVASHASGVGGGRQVGYVQVGPTVGHIRASIWSGTAGSWVNLHPAGMDYSFCYSVDGSQQVGDAIVNGIDHASVWSGSSASWVDLTPAGVFSSNAWCGRGGQQVGWTNVGYFRAALWTGSAASWVNLNPPPDPDGYEHASEAFATDGSQQVGYVVDTGGVVSASLWNGSAAWVNLHPAGNISSWAYGVRGGKQVGVVRVPDTSSHAALWSGSAASWIDLHPAGAFNSRASDVEGGRQVGYTVAGGAQHASLWSGTAASWVDLHTLLPSEFTMSGATAINTEGGVTTIAGWGFNNNFFREEAVIWVGSAPVFCAGDLDGDNAVTSADIPGFVAALMAGGACPAPPATCPADLNSDGMVDSADLPLFLTKLLSGGTCP